MVAAETHPPALFTMLPMDEYKVLLASICPFLFVHLGSISRYVLVQSEFYADYEFFQLFMLPPVSLEARKNVLADAFPTTAMPGIRSKRDYPRRP